MSEPERLSADDLAAESATALPRKEVMSLLDLNADVDLALDLAAPVDLAIAANLNVAAPINAAASANILSVGSDAVSVANQGVLIDQTQSGDAIANARRTRSSTRATTRSRSSRRRSRSPPAAASPCPGSSTPAATCSTST